MQSSLNKLYEKPPKIGIGPPITERPSHNTIRTDRVYVGSTGISLSALGYSTDKPGFKAN